MRQVQRSTIADLQAAQRDVFATAADGTRLYADDRGPLSSGLTPVLCLPGLTRNSRDFEPVMEMFSNERRVIACDLRGRGRSGYAHPSTYTLHVELQDVLAVMDHLGIGRAALLGTSRGGLIGMLMAGFAKQRLAGLFLNDIGPELEASGLSRIVALAGSAVRYAGWDEAARGFSAASKGFEGVDHDGWLRVVRRIYIESGGYITQSHDLSLAASLPAPDAISQGTLPQLWEIMPALAGLPAAVLRGENSDLLSAAVARRMAASGLAVSKAAGRGHVPFLDEPESVAAIRQWLRRVDQNEKGR